MTEKQKRALKHSGVAQRLHVQAPGQEGQKARVEGEYGHVLHLCGLGESSEKQLANVAHATSTVSSRGTTSPSSLAVSTSRSVGS